MRSKNPSALRFVWGKIRVFSVRKKSMGWARPSQPFPGLVPLKYFTLGGRDSGRLGLSVRTWLAEAATAAELRKKFELFCDCPKSARLCYRPLMSIQKSAKCLPKVGQWSECLGHDGSRQTGGTNAPDRAWYSFGPILKHWLQVQAKQLSH